MNLTQYIYLVFILKNLLINFVGQHYPIELIKCIVMVWYEPIKISCGAYHTCLITSKIYVYGNDINKLSEGNIFNEVIMSIASGTDYTVCSTIRGDVYTWGQIELADMNRATQLCLTHIDFVSCGARFAIAVSQSDYHMYVWGDNTYGQLGLDHYLNQSSPHKLNLGNADTSCQRRDAIASCQRRDERIVSVKCGKHHVVCLLASGTIYVWGRNDRMQLGDTVVLFFWRNT